MRPIPHLTAQSTPTSGGGRYSHRPPFLFCGGLLLTLTAAIAGCTRTPHVAPANSGKDTAAQIATATSPATLPPGQQLNAEQLFAKVSGAVVLVLNPQASSLGSGVEIAPNRFVTNCHVLINGRSYFIKRKDKRVAAQLVAGDVDRDVCLLSADDGQSQPVETRSASTVRVGEEVFAIGNPQGLEQTLSQGIVSALRHQSDAKDVPYIQTTAPISQGSSGGGLFDAQGRLIGIPSFMSREGQNLNFAAPIDWALQIAARNTRNYVSRNPQANAVQPQNPFGEGTTDDGSEVSDAASLAANGRELMKAGRARQALPYFIQAVALEPRVPSHLTDLGWAYLRSGQVRDALDALAASLQMDDTQTRTWLLMGEALSYTPDVELSAQSVLHALANAPDSAVLLEQLKTIAQNPQVAPRWRQVLARVVNQVSASAATL